MSEDLISRQPDHTADIGKKAEKEDCISRQAAIDYSVQGRCELMQMYPAGGWYCGNARRRGGDSNE